MVVRTSTPDVLCKLYRQDPNSAREDNLFLSPFFGSLCESVSMSSSSNIALVLAPLQVGSSMATYLAGVIMVQVTTNLFR